MNWTASLLRNELKKQKETYESRLNLLTNASLDAQNYLDLEEKLKVLEANLKATEQNLTKLKSEVELKEKDKETELKEQETQIAKLEKKIATSKELIFNLRKEIRELNLYHQRNLRTSGQSLKEQLAATKKELATKEKESKRQQAITQEWKEACQDSERNLRTLETSYQASQKELNGTKELLEQLATKSAEEKAESQKEFTKLNEKLLVIEKEKNKKEQELNSAIGKTQALEKIFETQIVEIIKKNIILRKSKDLKQAFSQIKEIMGWTGLVLSTDTTAGTSSVTPNPEEE